MRVIVVGAGAAGLVTALLLQRHHDVRLFEADPVPGGHTRTVHVGRGDTVTPVELGFRYFFESSHPTVMALMAILGLEVREREIQVALSRPGRGRTVVFPPRSARHVLALARQPRLAWQLATLRRFLVEGEDVADRADWSHSIGEHVESRGYSQAFANELLYPMLSSSWGAPSAVMRDFPAYPVLKVMRLTDGRARILDVERGLGAYVQAIVDRLDRVDLRLGAPVRSIDRDEAGLVVTMGTGEHHRADRVVLATPWHAAAELVSRSAPLRPWHERLRPFEDFTTEIAVHGDPRWMPRSRADWAELHHVHAGGRAWMTEWPGRDDGVDVFRSWLPDRAEAPDPLWHHRRFRHLVMTRDTPRLQRELAAIQGVCGLHAAGMYVVDADNHESSIASAMDVAEALAPRSAALAELRRARDAGLLPSRVRRATGGRPALAGADELEAR